MIQEWHKGRLCPIYRPLKKAKSLIRCESIRLVLEIIEILHHNVISMLCICWYLHCLPENSKTPSKDRTHYNNKGLRFNLTIFLQMMPKWFIGIIKKRKKMGMRLKSCIICLVSNQKKEVIFQSKFPTYISVFGQHAIEEKKKNVNCTNHTTWAHLSSTPWSMLRIMPICYVG